MDKLNFFEEIRKDAEETYKLNPEDADNLMRWGEALLELSQFQNVIDSLKMIQDAISKLEDAILIDPMKHDAVWCLGNAYTSYARLTPDDTQARLNFGLAYLFFGIAVAQQPDNQVYHKSLEMADKAPQLHTGFHKNRLLSLLGGVETLAIPSPKVVKNKKSSDEKYIVMGWVILAIGVVACISFRKLR
ncbi:TOM20-like protein [Arabidopsis thaliana]|jgi:tetratricopeptide (TPR) repeat protein|uniref:Mitochondrial import receptor subunit TOM20-1 n=1 Tax=Arabidopsis thaliana TaxID=3702 RepID=TO201_ARATH|nr:translocase outer membrane 20-1 [Arabidopsis thaliana]P82872.1 RecName: Full=Mitochondrial import receptor subunit TOM20-1; AltName: Full=Translocase of outer membrane 20 kDa subunit 1 [Arabidopsis thaliana]AEE77262.1 translocase outer membrane 20-1 [Arabidopsis thaliana]BAB01088.1 TOM20-like protein [Arabidopsis thaliana]CAC17150.1 TOM20-1 protein [Arabidopsis thaliana]|eukprot:NP_189343.1 translocase outer membrane 20-1 [Arabidopsis thaliana]